MKSVHLTVLALALTAGPASALSCLMPDAARLYATARDSDQVFAIVTGRLMPDGPIAVPEVKENGSPNREPQAVTRVRMTGKVLGQDAFDRAFDREVDVKVTCLSIWCGDPLTDRDIVAALRLGGAVPELEIGPCGGNAVEASDAAIQRLLACHRSGDCGM